MVGTKVYDNTLGWGEIIAESESYFVVRYDADPWVLRQYPKGEE